MSSLDGKKMASGQPCFAWLNWANCCESALLPTVPSIWLIVVSISGWAFLKASAAGTRGGSTHTVMAPPESVCAGAEAPGWPGSPPPPPHAEASSRASEAPTRPSVVRGRAAMSLVFIDTPVTRQVGSPARRNVLHSGREGTYSPCSDAVNGSGADV